MAWKMLDEATARRMGASCTEEVIQLLCADCADGNLDFDDNKGFCPIQVDYGWDGEHPSIQYDDESNRRLLRCNAWREAE